MTLVQPGLLILHGNRLELLRQAVFEWTARHPLAPLEAEVFLVQSNGVAEWLKMALAAHHGICAATRVELPARFLWRSYRQVLGTAAVPSRSATDKTPLTWRLLQLLPSQLPRPEYSASTRSVLLTDGIAGVLPQLQQVFSPQIGQILISFDFRLSTLAGNPWMFVPVESSGFQLNNIRLGGTTGTGGFELLDRSGTASILSLTAGTWYQTSISLNLSTSTYSGSVTPFGGNATSWTNRSLFQGANLGRVVFSDSGSADMNGSIAIDNVSVQTVPEPQKLVLLGLGGGLICLLRRYAKSRETQTNLVSRLASDI